MKRLSVALLTLAVLVPTQHARAQHQYLGECIVAEKAKRGLPGANKYCEGLGLKVRPNLTMEDCISRGRGNGIPDPTGWCKRHVKRR
jgi:hypothetical protein